MSFELVPLDVRELPRMAPYGPEEREVDLASRALRMLTTTQEWARLKVVRRSRSFGFAAAHPGTDPLISAAQTVWNNPYQFVWFVTSWGPEGDRHIANAVRMLRPTLRTGKDTLALRQSSPGQFWNVVESEAKGMYPWGDFPYGGATTVRVGNIVLPCAMSGFREVENDLVAKSVGGYIGATMLKVDYPEMFDA
jgi:hypothetical protein